MDWIVILIIVLAVLIIGGFIAMLVITMPIAEKVYKTNLVKKEKEEWGRCCSALENEEQLTMWNTGIAWAETVKDKKTDVHIVNDGLNLYGEYYDFGYDRAVIILPGRCECLMYSYFYAISYAQAKTNILVIDTRAHGLSDGEFNTIGEKESGDVDKWIELLENEFNIHKIILHSICVGSSTALIEAVYGKHKDLIKAVITDGCYVTFAESFKQHIIDTNHPWFPVNYLVMYKIYNATGTNVYKNPPIKLVKKLNCDMMVMAGKLDKFSLPSKTQKLYDACCAKNKKLVWFEKGAHSHIRINNVEQYDRAVIDFMETVK